MNRRVAILGATGLVGQMMLRLLEERDFPLSHLRLLASDRPGERSAPFRGASVPVEPVGPASFDGVELALFASRNPVSEHWAGPAQSAGARVVDNSSAFRYRPEIPLVIPEVNGHRLIEGRPGLIANPNCSTIGIVMALAPLARAAALRKLVISTYQSVSGGGGAPLAELERGIRAGLDGPPPRQESGLEAFAFNVLPHIDRFEENGYTREEMKIVWETRKLLDLPSLPVSATACRVPVRVGHAAAIHAVFDRPVEPAEARERWRAFPGLEVLDDPATSAYPTPLQAAGRDAVLVGRARRDLAEPNGLSFFVCSDNLRKGAALNAVQIAEALVRVEVAS